MQGKYRNKIEHEIWYFNPEKKIIIQVFPNGVGVKEILDLEARLYDLGIGLRETLEGKWKVYIVAPQLRESRKYNSNINPGTLLREYGYIFIEKNPKDVDVEHTAKRLLYEKGLL